MAEYIVTHPKLPEGINGVTTVETAGGLDAARELAASHTAAILRHRDIVAGACPDDVIGEVGIELLK